MTKPSPIAVVALCIVAVSILAFTINDQFNGRKNSISHKSAISKNANIISPIVTRNPPHGEPGHRHDLPDGAPLPTEGAPEIAAPITNNLSLGNPTLQSGENTASGINPAHGEPGHVCSIPVGAPLNSANANQGATTVSSGSTPTSGKNPAHGQPGHRCDIAVGAPLNSAPATGSVATTTANNSTLPGPKTTTVASGLNPAHGQPGHRCDIAVGAPLNSAPQSNTPSTTTTSTTSPNQKLNPSIFPNYSFPNNDSTTAATPQFQYDSTGAALNPPHGQPGHDCSISVGKPLKK